MNDDRIYNTTTGSGDIFLSTVTCNRVLLCSISTFTAAKDLSASSSSAVFKPRIQKRLFVRCCYSVWNMYELRKRPEVRFRLEGWSRKDALMKDSIQ